VWLAGVIAADCGFVVLRFIFFEEFDYVETEVFIGSFYAGGGFGGVYATGRPGSGGF
jgi:hypothetical protein